MTKIDSDLFARLAKFLTPGVYKAQENEGKTIDMLKRCELPYSEAVDIRMRLQNISRCTRYTVDELIILFCQIHAKGFADSYDQRRFIYYGIPIRRVFSQLWPEMESITLIPFAVIKECIVAMTDEGGLFYRKAAL